MRLAGFYLSSSGDTDTVDSGEHQAEEGWLYNIFVN
jgi:hypothetical protein